MQVNLAEVSSIFIEFRLSYPLCVLLRPLFVIVILFVFVYDGQFLIPPPVYGKMDVSASYTMCVVGVGVCSFLKKLREKILLLLLFKHLLKI